jgi:hypothetical protein
MVSQGLAVPFRFGRFSLGIFCFSGEKSSENYDKVEKWLAKREDKAREQKSAKKSPKTPSRNRGLGFNPYWHPRHGEGYPTPPAAAGYSPYAPAAAGYPPYPGPSTSGYPTPGYRPPADKSRLRCNKCQELGHLFRECPNSFVAK